MAITLNLVKSRLISSQEELSQFKKEATASLLKFAQSNVCDLDAISKLLTAKYAEINTALTSGYKVESGVDILPEDPAAAPVPVVDLAASGLTPNQLNRTDLATYSTQFEDMARKYQLTPDLHSWMVSREGESLDLGNVPCSEIEAAMAQFAKKFGLATDKKSKKSAALAVGDEVVFSVPFDKAPGYDAATPNLAAPGSEDWMVGKEGVVANITQEPGLVDVTWADGGQNLVGEIQLQKKACLQRVAEPIHPPLPVEQAEGNPEAQDPLDLMMQAEERQANEPPVPAELESAGTQLDEQDIAALIGGSPEKQETAGKIVGSSKLIGKSLAWALLCRVATGSYNAAQLKELNAALRVVAADEPEESVEAEHAGEAVPVITPEKPEAAVEPLSAVFQDPAARTDAESLLQKFNAMMAKVDKPGYLLMPVTVDDILREKGIATKRERPAPDSTAGPVTLSPETAPEQYAGTHGPVLPMFNGISDEEQQSILADQNSDDEVYHTLTAWYMGEGADIDADMAAGVDEAIKGKPEAEGISGEQIIAYLHADPANDKIITYDDIPRIIGEIKKEQAGTGKGEAAAPAQEEPAPEKPAEEPVKEPVKEEPEKEEPAKEEPEKTEEK